MPTIGRIILFLAFAVPLWASAHAVGESYETRSGPYTIDIGYSTKQAATGESVLFDFLLRNGTQEVAYPDVWVTVTSTDNAVVLATGVHNSEFGGPRLSYVFPAPGRYTVAARYENGTTTLAEASFPIDVLPSGTPLLTPPVGLAFLLGIAFGAMALFIVFARRARGVFPQDRSS